MSLWEKTHKNCVFSINKVNIQNDQVTQSSGCKTLTCYEYQKQKCVFPFSFISSSSCLQHCLSTGGLFFKVIPHWRFHPYSRHQECAVQVPRCSSEPGVFTAGPHTEHLFTFNQCHTSNGLSHRRAKTVGALNCSQLKQQQRGGG